MVLDGHFQLLPQDVFDAVDGASAEHTDLNIVLGILVLGTASGAKDSWHEFLIGLGTHSG